MRIGVVTTSFPRTPDDPSGVFVRDLAQALANRGHAIDVLAPEPAESLSTIETRIEDGGIGGSVCVRWIPYMRPRVLSRTFYGAGVPDNLGRSAVAWLGIAPFALATIASVRTRMRAWDAVLTHWAMPCALLVGAAKFKGPHVAIFHGSDVHWLGRLPARRKIASALAQTPGRLVFVSPQLRYQFLDWLDPSTRASAASRSAVQPMGFADSVQGVHSRSMPTRPKDLRVLFIGRLVAIKGVDVLIEAVARTSGCELWIAGDGPLRSRLERQARARNIRVRFFGSVGPRQKRELLRRASVLVVPSIRLESGRTEGTPSIILEAQAAGLPVIATRTGGVPSVVRNGIDGVLVPPGEPGALAAALDFLCRNPDWSRTIGQQAEKSAAPHAWPCIAERMERWMRERPTDAVPPRLDAGRSPR